jgi:spermidine/putrescine-binding protein
MNRTRFWSRWVLAGITVMTLAVSGSPALSGTPLAPAQSGDPSAPEQSGTPSESSAPLESELVIESAGGTMGDALDTAFLIPFAAETGVNVIHDHAAGDPGSELEAQAAAGRVEWDLTIGNPASYWLPLRARGLLQDIDYSKIGPAADTLLEGGRVAVGMGGWYTAWGFAYNRAAFATPPTKMADFFDPVAFPGDRMVNNWGDAQVVIIDALLADGVAPADLTPLDLDRAFAKLDPVKPSIKVYFESGNEAVAALVDRRVVMCLCPDDRGLEAAGLNPDVVFAWDGALRDATLWAMPTNAPHPEAAYAFLRSTLDPARQAENTRLTGQTGIVQGLYDLLPPEQQETTMLNPANFEKTFGLTDEQVTWIADHHEEIVERWTAWISL